MAHERALRGLSLLATAIATPLLIATTIVSVNNERGRYWSRRPVTTFGFGFIPLTLTASISVASFIHYRKHGRLPGSRFGLLDLSAGVTYIAILLPIWLVEIGRLERPGWGLLAGYLTAPMIVNMFIHFFFVLYNLQAVWSSFISKGVHQCPNCHKNFIVGAPEIQQTATRGEGYSLLRGEAYLDEDAVPYADARTSEEQLDPKKEDKGKAIIDV